MGDVKAESFARLAAFVTRSDLSRNEKLVLHAVMASVHWDSWSDRVPAAIIRQRSSLHKDAYQRALALLVSKGMVAVTRAMGQSPVWRVSPDAILRQPVLPSTGSVRQPMKPAHVSGLDRPTSADETGPRERLRPADRGPMKPAASEDPMPLRLEPPKIRATEDPSHHEEPPTPLQGDPAIAGMDVPAAQSLVAVVAPAPAPVAPPPPAGKPKPPPAARKSTGPFPESLSARSDAGMWQALWSKVPAATRLCIDDVARVWDAYRAAFPKRRVLDDDGANKIAEALALGYTAEELCRVPAGAALSPYHMGQNDQRKTYIDVVTLFREARTIEQHIERSKPVDVDDLPRTPTGFGSRGGWVPDKYDPDEVEIPF